MTKERQNPIVPDVSGFQPRPVNVKIGKAELDQASEDAGFTTRHAPEKITKTIDARSLRRTARTSKLNIALTEEARNRFWEMAQEQGVNSGADLLQLLMDNFDQKRAGEHR